MYWIWPKISTGTTSNLIRHLKEKHKITKESHSSGNLIQLGSRQLTIIDNTSKFSYGMDIWSSPNGIPFMGLSPLI
jgi:CTP-dependent riboflavin kinase